MSAIKGIPKNSVTEEVYKQVFGAISNGEWAPGTKIPSENELAKEMGVSRISIRSAIQRLSSIGLVESKQGEGTFVCEYDGTQQFKRLIPTMALGEHGLRNVMELRMVIEGSSAALAAKRCDEDSIATLKEIYEKHKNTEDLSEAARLDLLFHYNVAKTTNNPLIMQVFSILSDFFSESFREIVQSMGTTQALHYHSAIINAFENHDEDKAFAMMDKHVRETVSFLEEAEMI